MPEDQASVTMLDVYNRIGEMNGTLKTFMENQKDTNDILFSKNRDVLAVIKDHGDFIEKTKPLIPTLENLDTGRKFTKWGLVGIISLGSANLLVPAWQYIKTVLSHHG